jgi:hypothetical protein
MLIFPSFSVRLPQTTSLMICLLCRPLLNLIFATNSIVISAPTLNMLRTQSLGGTRSGMFILASIAWRWIISLFLVSFLIFQVSKRYLIC